MNFDELRIIPVLKALTDEQLHFLLKSSREKTYKKRESIFNPEEVNNYVIMLLQGRVRIYLAYPDGREFTIAFLEPG
ncbi:MAG: cyclic nucleotide-binding domain-containing protein, partial [Desulfitobacteriaceae bacterium]|nr:cyclic nucleotide-binding domain-containing protein [Desulfitobacteriaceae bacterium]